MTFEYPDAPLSDDGPVEIGPPPYYHRSDCNICRKQDGLPVPPAVITPDTGGPLVVTEHFVVDHAPLEASVAGTVIVFARRHLLDFGEMTATESGDLGAVLHRLVPAVKAATGVERVYYLALMERVGHFHLWLVPKLEGTKLRGADYLAHPGQATASEAQAAATSIRAEFDST